MKKVFDKVKKKLVGLDIHTYIHTYGKILFEKEVQLLELPFHIEREVTGI